LYEAWDKPLEAARWRREQLEGADTKAKPSQTQTKAEP
jgi:hypothetical protein